MKFLKPKKTILDLSNELLVILNEGFIFEEGCVFLKFFKSKKTNATLNEFEDKTGYEAFINSFHIEDYTDKLFVESAFLFVEKLFYCWSLIKLKNNIRVIISENESDVVVKVHVVRNGESLLTDDIEDYDSAILIVDSDEKSFSKFKAEWSNCNPNKP